MSLLFVLIRFYSLGAKLEHFGDDSVTQKKHGARNTTEPSLGWVLQRCPVGRL